MSSVEAGTGRARGGTDPLLEREDELRAVEGLMGRPPVQDSYISGRAMDGDGAQKDFSGWIGLTGAIDTLIADATDRPPETLPDRRPATHG